MHRRMCSFCHLLLPTAPLAVFLLSILSQECKAALMFDFVPPPVTYYIDVLNVSCSTSSPAAISWLAVTSSRNAIVLDEQEYGITQESATVSRLRSSGKALEVITGNLVFNDFICRATSPFGVSVNSTVFGFEGGKRPQLRTTPTDATLVEGESTNFYCKTSAGSPAPLLFWKFKSQLTGKESLVGDERFEVNRLQEKVNRTRAGTYSCVAENQFGSIKASATLVVQYRPVDTRISFEPKQSHERVNDVRVTCSSDSVPVPNFTFHQSEVAPRFTQSSPSLSFHIYTSTLTIKSFSVDNSTVAISCTAQNSLGKDTSEEKILTIIVPPDPPSNLQRLSSLSDELCWEAVGFDGNSALQQFNLTCTPSKTSDSCTELYRSTNDVIPIMNSAYRKQHCASPTGIVLGVSYNCFTSVKNVLFHSLQSEIVNFVSTTGTVTRRRSVQVVLIAPAEFVTSSSITVHWCISNLNRTENITNQTLIAYQIDDKFIDNKFIQYRNLTSTGGYATMPNLFPNASYFVRVILVYSGESVLSNLVTYTTAALMPVHELTSSSVSPTPTTKQPKSEINTWRVVGGTVGGIIIIILGGTGYWLLKRKTGLYIAKPSE